MPDNIPLGICRKILLRLPAASLLRFRPVCKRWRTVMDDPCFVKAHASNQLSSNGTNIIIRNSVDLAYFNLEDLDFTHGPQTIPAIPLNLTLDRFARPPDLPVAACNGLMLTAPEYRQRNWNDEINWDSEGTLELRNLLTHECLKLPQPNIQSKQVVGVGLGYDCAADDYKAVVIDYQHDDVNDKFLRQTHVYSLKSDSWRMIGNCPFDDFSGRDIQYGVFLNGALHWVSDYAEVIVFDVGTESYRQLALPEFKRRPKTMQLDELSGRLFLSYHIVEDHRRPFDVWVMDDYGGKDSWIKLFELNRYDVSYYLHLRPVAYIRNKKRLLLHHSYGFIWYDFESDSIKTINIDGFLRDITAQNIVGSIFRLHGCCGRVLSQTRMRTRKMKMTDTKLTFRVSDVDKYYRRLCPPFDTCYIPGPNLEGNKICATSFNPSADSCASIPLDICREILLRLPAKSLIRFRAVCKAYLAVIDEPGFVRAHTNKKLSSSNTIMVRKSEGPPFNPLYSFDLETRNLTLSGLSLLPDFPVAACNGLVLIANETLEIWNPLTHERLELPGVKLYFDRMAIGIGYDYATNDYKVVVIHSEEEEKVYRTHVYSLRLDSWREIGNCPRYGYDDDHDWPWLGPGGPGVFLFGALHWPLFDSPYGMDNIIALDLGTEKYCQLQAPPLRERTRLNVQNRYLDVLGGCLIVSDYGKSDIVGGGIEHFDLWVMKDYGVGDSWIKLFSVEDEELDCYFVNGLRAVAYMKDKTQILLQGYRWGGFFLFDIESNSMERVGVHGLTGDLQAQIINESIFRLHDNRGVIGRGGDENA